MTRSLLVALVLTAAAAAQGFDPYKKQVVDYGVPKDFPGNPHHDQLTCFYYRDLMVKQLTNRWIKGALFLSFLRFDQARPACVKEHSPNEKVLGYPEWAGYFKGRVTGDLIFFDSDDGEDGGMPFAVYDSKTQKKTSRTMPTMFGCGTRSCGRGRRPSMTFASAPRTTAT